MREQHSETGESSAVLQTVELTDSLEARTLNVRQGAFAIATKQDTLNRLRTGNLGPCVAFYGINRRAGVTFMSHVDGNLCGFRALEDRLSSATNGDLESFALYATTNYTMTARLGCLALVCAAYPWLPLWLWLGLIAVVVGFGCASLLQIYIFARRAFGTWRVKLCTPLQFSGRVEVSLDAASSGGPSVPQRETVSRDESERRYGRLHCWVSGQRELNPTREVLNLTSERDALREVVQALDSFQREYGAQALDPDGMPGNEHYRSRLIELVSNARAALAVGEGRRCGTK